MTTCGLVVAMIFLIALLNMKSTTITVQAKQLEQAKQLHNLVEYVYSTHRGIIAEREKKQELCSKLGKNAPLQLIEDGVCPKPL